MNFQDAPVEDRDTDKAPKGGGASDGKGRNANILPGGEVDPRSRRYQRNVAQRGKLADYLQGLWDQGMDEADVFMAGVKSLESGGHGYVGAYLDEDNPNRRYNRNEAMAITDAVMKKAGIGEHPGNRLTRPKDDEGKEERKVGNQLRAMEDKPKVEPGPKAMSVRQQRKQGKRPSTGQPRPPGGDREGLASRKRGETDETPVSEWQKTLHKWGNGEAALDDVLKAFQKEKQSKISESPQAKAQRKKKRAEDRARETAAPDVTDEEIATPKEKAKWKAPGEGREDRSSVEEAKTGVAGASGGMLSAQSTPVIGPWSRNEREYKQSITDTFDRLLNQEIQFQYDDIKGIRDPKQKNSIRNKIYSDPKDLEYIFKDTIYDFISKDDSLKGTDFDKFARDHLNRLVALRTGQEIEPETPIQQPPLEEAKRTAQDRQAQASPEEQAAPEEQAPPEEQAAPAAPKRKPSRRGFGALVPKQSAPRGGDPFTPSSKPTPDQIKAIKEKVAKVPKEQLIKEMEQGTLFPAGLVTETSQTNPLEGGSTGVGTPDTEQPVEQRTPEETGGSLLDEEGAAKDFRKSGPEKPKPSAKKPTQRSIRGLGPSAGKFDTTRTQKAGDELLTQDLKSYGFTPKQVKEIQRSGLTEKERQTITQRRRKTQEEKAKQAPKVAEERGGSLLDGEDQAKDFRKSGPQAPSKPAGGRKARGPLNQIAKAVLDGIERDKAARETAGQFFNRVRQLVQEQAGKGTSKSDVDQATADAINQQKSRTTRNKTGKKGVSNNAEYQEFAQSIRSLMR